MSHNHRPNSRDSSQRKRSIPGRFLDGLEDFEEPPTKPPRSVNIPKKKTVQINNSFSSSSTYPPSFGHNQFLSFPISSLQASENSSLSSSYTNNHSFSPPSSKQMRLRNEEMNYQYFQSSQLSINQTNQPNFSAMNHMRRNDLIHNRAQHNGFVSQNRSEEWNLMRYQNLLPEQHLIFENNQSHYPINRIHPVPLHAKVSETWQHKTGDKSSNYQIKLLLKGEEVQRPKVVSKLMKVNEIASPVNKDSHLISKDSETPSEKVKAKKKKTGVCLFILFLM